MPEPEAEAPSSTERHLQERTKMTSRQLDDAQRELALLRSGVDLDHPHGRVFIRALKASQAWKDMTPTAEEIRSTAESWDVPIRGQRRDSNG